VVGEAGIEAGLALAGGASLMREQANILVQAIRARIAVWLMISVGFLAGYYLLVLVVTMIRFGEIPNYLVFHDIISIYGLIIEGTPSLVDAIPILLEEAWFETGYKNPDYYGVATWSYMLIPPKMLLVLFGGMLLATFYVLRKQSAHVCSLAERRTTTLGAGIGTSLIGLTSVTLTWVVCCATPSWVVALAMLGMNASLALFIEPIGKLLTFTGFAIFAIVIMKQLRSLAISNQFISGLQGHV
jgi:hypothetical protein